MHCHHCNKFYETAPRFCGDCGAELQQEDSRPKSGELIQPHEGQSFFPAPERQPDRPAVHNQAQPFTQVNLHSSAEPSQPAAQTINVNVNAAAPQQPYYYVPPVESSAFAIITLIVYLSGVGFMIAAVMNLIGMVTGPRRGCFVAMFFLICIPGILLIGLAIILSVSGAFGP
jgi:hypothetical protein